MSEPLLTVSHLQMVFRNKKRAFCAVNDVNIDVLPGQVISIVGESGSGKTMAALSILRLLPHNGYIEQGSILYKGQDLLKMPEQKLCSIRGKEIAMIFQDPIMSLDQVFTVGYQLVEAILTHENVSREEAKERSLALLASVGIANPIRVFNSYPFQLSGGMCQRAMIAIALSCNPSLLIADEPTTALDVTVQAQILDLLKKIRDERHIGIILITHDLDVVSDIAEKIVVMYSGMIMEQGSKEDVFGHPAHMYTKGLLRSIPRIDLSPNEKLYNIPGVVADIRDKSPGCRFASRCELADDRCRNAMPEMSEVTAGHFARCWKLGN